MTDYDHWPPIRFRFSGDVEQAKGRIPQARTLMAQLIRRMEGFQRDTGQWQGQMSDGTQFRVAKMGDVHVADIFGVTPSIEPPVTERGVAYDLRVITPGTPMVANPETVIPETVIPEIPEPPYIPQREILMRPHGERFGSGTGDYLWVGVSIDYADATPVATTDTVTSCVLFEYQSGPSPGYVQVGENTTPGEGGVIYEAIKMPYANLMLFEPGWQDNPKEKSVMQSVAAFEPRSSIDPYSVFTYEDIKTDISVTYDKQFTYRYSENERTSLGFVNSDGVIVYFSGGGTNYTDCSGQFVANYVFMYADQYGPDKDALVQAYVIPAYSAPAEITTTSEESTLGYIFNQICEAPSGVCTSYPFVAGGYGQYAVDAYLLIEPKGDAKTKADYLDARSTDSPVIKTCTDTSIPVQTIASSVDFSRQVDYGDPKVSLGGEIQQYYISGTTGQCEPSENVPNAARIVSMTVGNPDPKHTKKECSTSTYTEVMFSDDNLDFTHTDDGKAFDGLYELRLALGGGNSFEPDQPVDCTVFIQVDKEKEPKSYRVTVPALGELEDAIFNTETWLQLSTPTPVSDTWYPGCWLIDIKNQTIIHETRPDRLERDWFTTE